MKAKATSAGKPKVAELTPPTKNGESLKKATLMTATSTKEKVSLEAETPNVREAKSATTSIPTFSSVEDRRTSQQQPIPLQKKGKGNRFVIADTSDEESEEEETMSPAFSGNKHEREESKDLSHEESKDLSDILKDEETKPPAEKKPRLAGTASTADSAPAPPPVHAFFGNASERKQFQLESAKNAANKKEKGRSGK